MVIKLMNYNFSSGPFHPLNFDLSAIWLLPEKEVYGGWPASGEIDIVEIMGMTNLESLSRLISYFPFE